MKNGDIIRVINNPSKAILAKYYHNHPWVPYKQGEKYKVFYVEEENRICRAIHPDLDSTKDPGYLCRCDKPISFDDIKEVKVELIKK